jgi:hypothetical protein
MRYLCRRYLWRAEVLLCPRALAVLKRQLALRARFEAVGVIRHDHVFFRETGDPFRNLQIQARPRLCGTSSAAGVCSSRTKQQRARGNLAVGLPLDATRDAFARINPHRNCVCAHKK